MASDNKDSSSSQQTAKSSETQDQLRVTAVDQGTSKGLGSRRCYSMAELTEIAKRPLSKVCPAPLNLEKATSNNTLWLLKIIPGAHQEPQSSSDRPLVTAEERARALRSQDTDLGITFKPQRLSFTDGCRTSNAMSPQKSTKTIAVLSATKDGITRDSLEAFGDRLRQQDSGGIVRVGSREFVNSNNTRTQSNNNPRYGTYNNDRDRYNSTGPQNNRNWNYNDRSGQSSGGIQRSYNNQHLDDRDFGRGGGGYPRNSRDQDDNRQHPYHTGGDLEQEEPEWMNDGPTSQNECIELRGFDDDIPEDEKGSKKGSESEPITNGFTVDKETGQLRREPVKPKAEPEATKPINPPESLQAASAKKTTPAEHQSSAVPDGDSSLLDQTDKSSNPNLSFGRRSRFTDIFSSNPSPPDLKQIVDQPKQPADSSPSIPVLSQQPLPPKQQQQPSPITLNQPFSPQEAGRGLLQMLQKNDAPQAVPPLKPAVFKTLEDIEAEHQQKFPSAPHPALQQQQQRQLLEQQLLQIQHLQQQQQRQLFMQQQQPRPDGLTNSRPPSIGSDHFGSPLHRPSSPVQAVNPSFPRFAPDTQMLHIPDDPSLHKLLSLPHNELIHMRDTGHFDQNTLLTLVQMKSQKEAQQQAAFRAAAAAAGHRGGLPGQFPIPISIPISGPHHGLPLPPQQQQHQHNPFGPPPPGLMAQQMAHARMANGHIMAQQMRFNIPQQMAHNTQQMAHNEAVMRQLQQLPGAQSPTQLAHEMHMLRMEDLNRLEAARLAARQAQSQGQSPSNGQRPSPLLPTAVMRKTVQRGDSMNNMLPASQMHQSASSPQLLDGFQNHLQNMQPQQQQQQLRMSEEEFQHRNMMMAHREEEHQRLIMAQRQQQLQGQQYQFAPPNFPMQQQQQHGLSGHAHNMPQPDF
ncbi:hypothetical protein BV898_08466 [Hypsibius exemplaris]|uniref:Eukaryotic translation initiation factor 4E transporter n=1 Tax=Hypsibius exemplaris TaxID=2072580 RepID=A0A1W0WQQ2_HYPEX|nr:hypothetical protein BV898_08466 [Hypsibius exemplaris]